MSNNTETQIIAWQETGQYTDIKYHKAEGIAKITINRPEVRNAFRPETVFEMDIDNYFDFLSQRRVLMAKKIKEYYKNL